MKVHIHLPLLLCESIAEIAHRMYADFRKSDNEGRDIASVKGVFALRKSFIVFLDLLLHGVGDAQSHDRLVLAGYRIAANEAIGSPIAVIKRMYIAKEKMEKGDAEKRLSRLIVEEGKGSVHLLDDSRLWFDSVVNGNACFVDHVHHFGAKEGAIGNVLGIRGAYFPQNKAVVDIAHVRAGLKGDVWSRLEESIFLDNTEKPPAAIILLQALKNLADLAAR